MPHVASQLVNVWREQARRAPETGEQDERGVSRRRGIQLGRVDVRDVVGARDGTLAHQGQHDEQNDLDRNAVQLGRVQARSQDFLRSRYV